MRPTEAAGIEVVAPSAPDLNKWQLMGSVSVRKSKGEQPRWYVKYGDQSAGGWPDQPMPPPAVLAAVEARIARGEVGL